MLANRYGFTSDRLGWARRSKRTRRIGPPDAFRVGALYTLVLIFTSGLMILLRSLVGGGEYPAPPPAGWAGVIDGAASSIAAGVIEELVLVAVLVTVLEAARQRSWAIYGTAIGVRVSFHLYYGGQDAIGLVSVLPMVLWAAAAIALFRWTRLILPLIVVHALWDLQAFTAQSAGPEWQVLVSLGLISVSLAAAVGYVILCLHRQSRAARAKVAPLVLELAERFGVEPPRVRMVGNSHPELFRRWRGVVMRYDWKAASQHTDEQRRGWVAHALAHQRLGHVLKRRYRDTPSIALLTVAFIAALIPVNGIQHPDLVPPIFGVLSLLLSAVLALTTMWWLRFARRRAIRTSAGRFALETAADVHAATVVGPDAVRAAINTPNTYPREPKTPEAYDLPARTQRRAAVAQCEAEGLHARSSG